MILLLAVITTTVTIAVAISYFRRNKKIDKTGTQIHHTSPIYDTIPDIPESSNNNISSSRTAIPRHTTVLEGQDRNNNMMQQPNRHPVGSIRTRLEAHNNIMILDGNQQLQRARESIPISLRENEAYMYAVADQYQYIMSAPVQETNQEDSVNEFHPNKKDAENYIYPVTNKWVHVIQKD